MAQAELHRRTHDRLRGYLIRLGSTEEEADDLVADTFVVAIKRWSTRRPGKETAWVYGIARKKLLEHRKERGRFRHSVDTGTFTIDAQASAHEQCEASEQFFGLTAGEQEVVHLIYISKLSPEDVAELRGTTASAVYELLRSARARLAKGELDVA
jgi:RNA polymerase sigma-70 factor (ECF subfamily)